MYQSSQFYKFVMEHGDPLNLYKFCFMFFNLVIKFYICLDLALQRKTLLSRFPFVVFGPSKKLSSASVGRDQKY